MKDDRGRSLDIGGEYVGEVTRLPMETSDEVF